MQRKEKAILLLRKLEKMYPDARTELINWDTPFQFLVCIVLSAQTTDKQVNKVTKDLFEIYPDGYTMSLAPVRELEKCISSINYYKTKAKNIKRMSEILIKEYAGEIPISLEKLLELPGVGYKTANVFLNELYKVNQGIAVDTHVKKVSLKYGLTSNTDPNKIAKDLERLYPREEWYKINRYFVMYGRYDFDKDIIF
ncbi:endonuclease III [Candidatus Dojkabacteria bacterium]|uniref:Endonuclease III n=1 Tax=Candidatus Dojkabacteria bacterium TaxID=2099670 RepID=A0A847VC98_9BACT|nr:endonuclease III [Candidatus Dojkabacteria bacterium]